ncbi:MAG: sulfite reductase subunit A [Gammaproteobacteria bacterium]|nr:MAG: sulfite reductase subunit A [Gammaproteobacteria bacterium]
MTEFRFLQRQHFQQLIDVVQSQGYDCIGPCVQDGSIVYRSLRHAEQLPRGVEDRQTAGRYQLTQLHHVRYFAWANGPQAIKPWSFSAHETLWHCRRDSQGNLQFDPQILESKPLAIIGVRGCDLAALQLQRDHFLHQQYSDPWFRQRTSNLLLVAVHCSHPSDNCFCHATGDGPVAQQDCDIAMHELEEGFLITASSARGETILNRLPLQETTDQHQQQATQQTQAAINKQHKTLPQHVKERLHDKLDHPYWKQIGERCLSCGNCTAVCPTCFCHQQHEQISISDNSSSHVREWSSCFTHNHGYLAGYQFRPATWQRYRQWLTHKFSGWHDQYGRSGCVGCGRCISWCPAAIDVTAELEQLCNS